DDPVHFGIVQNVGEVGRPRDAEPFADLAGERLVSVDDTDEFRRRDRAGEVLGVEASDASEPSQSESDPAERVPLPALGVHSESSQSSQRSVTAARATCTRSAAARRSDSLWEPASITTESRLATCESTTTGSFRPPTGGTAPSSNSAYS